MEGTLQEMNSRWMGVVRSAAVDAVKPKLYKKLGKKWKTYKDFVEYIAAETGIKDGIIRGGIKIFLPHEGMPNPDRYLIFRKFADLSTGERVCFVRLPIEADYPIETVSEKETEVTI